MIAEGWKSKLPRRTRAADVSREAEERAAASVATMLATAAKGTGHGLPGGEGIISSYFLKV